MQGVIEDEPSMPLAGQRAVVKRGGIREDHTWKKTVPPVKKIIQAMLQRH
ncbi:MULTISPECIES: hypothetical protein [unclassified Schlesneria]